MLRKVWLHIDVVPGIMAKNLIALFIFLIGAHSVGAHVRDAGCYVAWAFARAYDPSLMAVHVSYLAPTLITTAVFDRYHLSSFWLLSRTC